MKEILKKKISEIDKEIEKLRKERKDLERQRIKDTQDESYKYVGRCFRHEDIYVKIISVPPERNSMTGVVFNEYQFPALYINSNIIPFEYDTFFIRDIGKATWEEVSADEFENKFDQIANRIKTLLLPGIDHNILGEFGEYNFWSKYERLADSINATGEATQICSCFQKEHGKPACFGTKEREVCQCDGNKAKCDFYPEYRESNRIMKG